MPVGFNVDINLHLGTLQSGIHAVPGLLDRLVAGVVQRQAGISEAYMRGNASWTDRTGNARAGLHAVAQSAGHEHSLTLAHGVPYGIWLEVRYAGRYAVILNATAAAGQDIFRLLDRALDRI